MVGGGIPGRTNVFRLMETLCPFVDDSTLVSKDSVMKLSEDTSLATLEPYMPKPLPQRRKPVRKMTIEDLFSPPVWSQYITLTLNEDIAPLSDLVIYCSLKKILNSDSPRFSVERNKIIRAKSEEESKRLLEARKLGIYEIKASDEAQYNTRIGTMLLDKLRVENDSNESICEALKEILEDQKQCQISKCL